MSTLVQRVERQPTSGMSDGIGESPGLSQAVRQLLQHLRQFQPQRLGLIGLPFVELERIGQREACQEVGPVEASRFAQRIQTPVAEGVRGGMVGSDLRSEIAKAQHVDDHIRPTTQSDLIPGCDQCTVADGAVEIR